MGAEDCFSFLRDVPWICNPYVGQLIYAILYGITSAAYVLLTTLVLADLLGADKFTNAFGLLLLFQGVATFIGPPIVGKLHILSFLLSCFHYCQAQLSPSPSCAEL